MVTRGASASASPSTTAGALSAILLFGGSFEAGRAALAAFGLV